jgi:hypothetical protein
VFLYSQMLINFLEKLAYDNIPIKKILFLLIP